MKVQSPQVRAPHEVVPDDNTVPADNASEFCDPALDDNLRALRDREQAARDRREELARSRDLARFD